jgi:hypothetical protein
MVSTTTGKVWGGRGVKGGRTRSTLVLITRHTRTQGVRSRPVYGAEGLWLLTFLLSRGVVCKPHNPFSPTHTDKTDTGSSARQRLDTQQQASWLKEVRKVKG